MSAVSLALFSWLCFLSVVVLYCKVKKWITNSSSSSSSVDVENGQTQRQASECVIETDGSAGEEGGVGGGEGGGEESPQPSRPAPSLPRKRSKGAAEREPRLFNNEASQPAPPSYEEIFKTSQV
ncbi:hypothetical protein ACLKA7_013225 [Drosophila subpalustris]